MQRFQGVSRIGLAARGVCSGGRPGGGPGAFHGTRLRIGSRWDWQLGFDLSGFNRTERPTDQTISLFDLDSECNRPTTYLVATIGREVPDLSELVDTYALEIFETELEGWWTDEAHWPVNRNPHVFRDWFDVTLSDLACDLDETEPICAAEDDNLSDGAPQACSWCGTPIDEDAPVLTVPLKGPRDVPRAEASIIEVTVGGRIVPAVVPKDDSEAAREGIPLVVFCGEPCAEAFTDAWEKERGAMNS